jgi:hypothetical protein
MALSPPHQPGSPQSARGGVGWGAGAGLHRPTRRDPPAGLPRRTRPAPDSRHKPESPGWPQPWNGPRESTSRPATRDNSPADATTAVAPRAVRPPRPTRRPSTDAHDAFRPQRDQGRAGDDGRQVRASPPDPANAAGPTGSDRRTDTRPGCASGLRCRGRARVGCGDDQRRVDTKCTHSGNRSRRQRRGRRRCLECGGGPGQLGPGHHQPDHDAVVEDLLAWQNRPLDRAWCLGMVANVR